MQNIIGLVALIAIAALLASSGFRTWRVGNRILKWGGTGLLVLLTVAASCASALAVVGMIKQHSRSAPVPDIKVHHTPELIARGKGISDGFCSTCHSKTGTLTGGNDFSSVFSLSPGSIVSSNLTAGGPLKNWSDGEVFRAIRNGVDAEGRRLMIMSHIEAGKLSDDDTAAVIAYLRSLPASGNPTPDPPDHFNLFGLAMLGAGMMLSSNPIVTGHISAPVKAPTFQFGEYVLSYQVCRGCHGQNLTGGVPGQLAPLGPDLNLVKNWTLQGFITTMRTGVDPDGHELSKQMPWRPVGRMDDDELAAVYEYLTHLPNS